MSGTAAVQSWVDEQRRPANPRRALDARTYVIDDTIRVGQSMGLALRGAGGQNRSISPTWDHLRCGTILQWEGPPNKPVVEISGCTGLVWEGINITVPADQDAAQCMLFRHGGGTLNIAIRDSGFIGGQVGIQCGTDSREQTVANLTLDNCHWERQILAAYRIVAAQSLEHLFLRPQFAFLPTAIDVQAGGDVSLVGGGSYEVGCILALGAVSENTRGFDVTSLRIDGDGTRTAWLGAYDVTRARTYGNVVYRSVGQNKGQLNSERPLFNVPPGCRCIVECCDFSGSRHDWARVHGDKLAAGELYVKYASGLDGKNLKSLVELKHSRAIAEFIRCGNLYAVTGDWRSWEAE